jgi:hypothetical protein
MVTTKQGDGKSQKRRQSVYKQHLTRANKYSGRSRPGGDTYQPFPDVEQIIMPASEKEI